MDKKIKIIIVDDHTIFRGGLKSLLSQIPNFIVQDEAKTGKEFLDILKTSKPDIVLMDIAMPEMDGIEAQKKIRSLYPEIKIIILSMEDDENTVLQLVEEGVNGYLLKNADPEEVEFALNKVVRENFYFSSFTSNRYWYRK